MTQPTIPLPPPWDFCYVWNGPYCTRKFSSARHNGSLPDESIPLYTADQMHDYADACVQAERNDVHSCHANCQRAGCVNVRLRADRDSLADALADLVRAVEQSDATPTDRAWQAAEFARHVLGDKRSNAAVTGQGGACE